MKQKIQKIIILSIVMIISVTFLRCQKDDDSSNQQQSKIQTVTLDEAKNFLTNSKINSFGKSANNKFENLEFDKISQEKINGTNQLLTVIPLATNNNLQNDRVLLLKVENEIKSAVFTMYPDENSVIGSFSGTLFSYSLDGNFISGYRAKNGVIVSYFVENNTVKSTSGKAIRLNEVVVENNYQLVYALDMFGSYSLFGNNNMYGGGYNDYNGVEYYSWDAGREIFSADLTDVIMPPPPKLPISDIKKFLSCLNTAASANLTVYAEKTNLAKVNVGHAFISISQGNNVMIYGFYPENGYDKSFSGPGIMGENGEHAYDVSGNIGQITPQQLQKIISLSEKYQNSWYDLDANNCSDFTADVLNIVGVASNNSFETPVTVANTLQKVPNHTSNPSYAPKTKRTCP
ncbi:hypothetical protein B0A75_11745 [Flavobacterium oncorhynchi]|uniref:Uncharacterized protein n=1 Tax=Flavobacterium oncorhynchi TaxID=728056 RepID=A0A226HYX7_9FLAO|nr:hypothetical protein [Flavobacterium oncorhynchi]OXA99312.1 hypothetical protein B0A75_11745 [Flavobacterium oncorhynchi]